MIRTTILFTMVLFLASQVHSQVHGNRVHYAEYGPNGKYIALAGDDLILLDRKNKEVRVVNAYNPEARNIAFSQDARYIAAESKNFGIYIYDLQDPTKAAVFFQGIKKRIGLQSRLKFSPDSMLLATSNSSKIVLYDLSKGNEGKVALTIPNDPSNSQRSQAAFDITPDWKTIFFNMQAISLMKEKGKYSFKYGKKMDWDRAIISLSVLAADGTKVAVVGRNGLDQRIYSLKTGDPLLINTNLKTYALAANKDFSKVLMNQAVWDLETKRLQIIHQGRTISKNTKTKISVANDNGDFMIGLYQYSKVGKLINTLQHKLTTFNRVSFEGKEVFFYKDYANGKRYDLFAANIPEGLRARTRKNQANEGRIGAALASSHDATYGINHLSRIYKINPVAVTAPLFSLSGGKGISAHISKNNLIALVNPRSIYLTELTAGANDLNKRKNIKSIRLPDRVAEGSNVKINVSPNNQFIAISYLKDRLDKEYGEFDTLVRIYKVDGTLMSTTKSSDVNSLTFSNDSQRLYFSSGKKLNCLTIGLKAGKTAWSENAQYSFYTESGRILAISLSEDDSMIGYASSNGFNKVVRAKYGNDVITCIMLDTDRFKVIKK